jgi:hypothetical protein
MVMYSYSTILLIPSLSNCPVNLPKSKNTMITKQQLQTVKENYLKARESLHPARNWDLGMARDAIAEVLTLLGVENPNVKLRDYANGEVGFDICAHVNADKALGDALLPLFEGLPHRTGEIRYGYSKTFYGDFCPWFYTSWWSLHNHILTWGETD